MHDWGNSFVVVPSGRRHRAVRLLQYIIAWQQSILSTMFPVRFGSVFIADGLVPSVRFESLLRFGRFGLNRLLERFGSNGSVTLAGSVRSVRMSFRAGSVPSVRIGFLVRFGSVQGPRGAPSNPYGSGPESLGERPRIPGGAGPNP